LCKPYDNFPSTHIAFAVIAAGMIFLSSGPILGSIMLVWALLVVLSTLLTKQHNILDITAGGLLGLAVFALIFFNA